MATRTAADVALTTDAAVDTTDARTSALVARLGYASDAIISAELDRLGRRVRHLGEPDRDAVRAALDAVVESLILAHVRALPHRVDQFDRLFEATPGV